MGSPTRTSGSVDMGRYTFRNTPSLADPQILARLRRPCRHDLRTPVLHSRTVVSKDTSDGPRCLSIDIPPHLDLAPATRQTSDLLDKVPIRVNQREECAMGRGQTSRRRVEMPRRA